MSEVLMPAHSKVKVRFVCPEEYKKNFSSSRCLLAISVGQIKHEGKHLFSTIEKINRSFSSCTIMLADTLKRYNLKLNYPATSWNKLSLMAKQAGDDWLARNAEIFNALTIPHEVTRWNDWLVDPKYKSCRLLIDILYEENKDFRMGIFSTAKQFIERMAKHSQDIDCIPTLKYTLEYIKEESAVYLLMANPEYDFVVYPSKIIPSFEIIYNHLIKPYMNSLNWVELKLE